jgi:hypothetical protein
MSETGFYGWQVSWYVFGTLASFAAALLFWRKGAASVGGGAPGIEKLTW